MPQPSRAHDPAAPAERLELSFGRSAEYDYDVPEPGSYRLPPIGPAADGPVLNSDGRATSLHQVMDGRITVLAFIYTRCADPGGCPLSIGLLYDLLYVSRADPAIGDNLALVAMSFDPEHDTPEVMAGHMPVEPSSGDVGAALRFLTAASAGDLAPVLAAYGQPIGRKPDAADPSGLLTHQLRVYLIDRAKRIRNLYSLGFLDPRLVVTDIRTLIMEERGAAPGN